ncbi:MAG: response regulator [Candidatus Saccharibacteria bacterium]
MEKRLIRVLMVDDDPDYLERCRVMFEGTKRIRISYTASSGQEAIKVAGKENPDAVLIDHGLLDMAGLDVAQNIAMVSENSQMFLVTEFPTITLFQKAKAAGIKGMFSKPFTDVDVEEEIEYAVDSIRRELAKAAGLVQEEEIEDNPVLPEVSDLLGVTQQPGQRKVVMVISPKGGVGKTTFAVNTACAVAKQAAMRVRVALLDLNEFGTVTIHLNLGSPEKMLKGEMSRRNILAWQYIDENITPEELKDYMVRHESGLWVVPSVSSPDQIALIDEYTINKVVKILRKNFDLVIIDLPPSINLDVSWASAELVDHVLLVATPDIQLIPGMSQIKRTLESLEVGEKCSRVINMFGIPGGLNMQEIDKFMPFPVLGVIKEDFRVREALKKGVPLVLSQPDSEFAMNIRTTINKIFPVFEASMLQPAPKSGILGRLIKRLRGA